MAKFKFGGRIAKPSLAGKAKPYRVLACGFTLIELLVYFSITVLLVSIGWGGLSNYRDTQALTSSTETILSALSEARTKTISSENNSQFGVYFESGRAVIFPGTVFSEPNSVNLEFKIERAVLISTTSLALSPNSVVFKKITGGTDNYGTIVLSLKSNSGKTKTISVSKTGSVAVQ